MRTSPNAVAPGRDDQIAMLQRLIDGLKKHQGTLPPFLIAGRPMTVADVIADLQSRLDASQAATAAKATWLNAVKNDHDERVRTKGVLAGVRECMLVAFDGQIDRLSDLGLIARKTGVLTPEQKLVAIAKGQATRLARHTMGKNQKMAIHGAPATGDAPGEPER
jgi:hypothetical protein